MRRLVFLLICVLLFTGCSSSEPAADASPAAKGETAAKGKAKGKSGAKSKSKSKAKAKGGKEAAVSAEEDLSKVKDFAKAELAFSEKRYRSAAIIAQNSIAVLKAEGASAADILKRKEYVADSQLKAGMYEKACLSYNELAASHPDNKQVAKRLKEVRKEYWDKVLNEQLSEAERLRDRKRFTPARSVVQEVMVQAEKAKLNPERANKVLASIDKAEKSSGAGAQAHRKELEDSKAPKRKPDQKPRKTKSKPTKARVVEATTEGEAESYPTGSK